MNTVNLYVIDEAKLPTRLDGLSDRQKYDRLVSIVEKDGAFWESIHMRADAFIRALESIDTEIGGTGFLPIFTFNNSPGNVLGDDSNCPNFGYFDPSQVQDLYETLNGIPNQDLKKLKESGGYTLETVLNVFYSAAEEANKRGHALAIIHS